MAIYEIRRGIFSDKTIKPVRLAEVEGGRVEGCFYPGDVISSDKDLSLHNRDGLFPFKRLPDEILDTDETEEIDELDTMKVSELKSMAEELDLDTSGAGKKAELIVLIRKATSAV